MADNPRLISMPRRAFHDKFGCSFALLLLLAGAFLRCPFILIHGRVWAEEGNVFLAQNWNRSPGFALFAAHFGYYSVWDNFVAMLAVHCAPLTWAALLFSWSSVLILLITGYLIYQAELLPSRIAKTLAVLTLLLTVPGIETWLNLINSEFYFAIWSVIILVSEPSRLPVRRNIALAIAVLSGPITTFLSPLFVLRALRRRRWPEIVQAAVVCAGACVQIAVGRNTTTANRTLHLHPLELGAVLLNKDAIVLFFGRARGTDFFHLIADRLHYSTVSLICCWAAALLFAVFLIRITRTNRPALVLLMTALLLAALEESLALHAGIANLPPDSSERYAFTPNVLIELALVAISTGLHSNIARTAARVLLALAFFAGFNDYAVMHLWKIAYLTEPWRQQVLRWEKDPSTPLQAAPIGWPATYLPQKQ